MEKLGAIMFNNLKGKFEHLVSLAENESKITFKELLNHFGLTDDKEAEKLMQRMADAAPDRPTLYTEEKTDEQPQESHLE